MVNMNIKHKKVLNKLLIISAILILLVSFLVVFNKNTNLETIKASKLIILLNQESGEKNIYIGKNSCNACKKFKSTLEEIEIDKKIYYFDTDKADSKELSEVKKIIKKLDIEINSVPVLLKLDNGNILKFDKTSDKTKIEEFINN